MEAQFMSIKLNNSNKYMSMECLCNGNFGYMSRMLNNYYNSYKKALALIKLGNINNVSLSLKPSPRNHKEPDYFSLKYTYSFYRDRGDKAEAPVTWKSKKAYEKNICNFNDSVDGYLFKNNQWYVVEPTDKGITDKGITEIPFKKAIPEYINWLNKNN